MSEEERKIVEDLLNINPREMTYEQLKSMQNGWWETLNLLSEQNKENKQLQTQLHQKENIIKEVREYIEKHIAMFKNGDILVDMNIDELLEILDKGE